MKLKMPGDVLCAEDLHGAGVMINLAAGGQSAASRGG